MAVGRLSANPPARLLSDGLCGPPLQRHRRPLPLGAAGRPAGALLSAAKGGAAAAAGAARSHRRLAQSHPAGAAADVPPAGERPPTGRRQRRRRAARPAARLPTVRHPRHVSDPRQVLQQRPGRGGHPGGVLAASVPVHALRAKTVGLSERVPLAVIKLSRSGSPERWLVVHSYGDGGHAGDRKFANSVDAEDA